MAKKNENVLREEQEPVRVALMEYLEKWPDRMTAAEKIGVSVADLYNWISGYRRIPAWMCEVLGFKLAYVRMEGPVRVTPLAARCMSNAIDRDARYGERA
jgi:hypothetical protein